MSQNERIWTQCFNCTVADDVAERYLSSLEWVLGRQNRDGSWGNGIDEQSLLTPQGVQLLVQAGFPSTSSRLQSAIGWLKTGLSHDIHPQWYGRIPALIAAGQLKWLQDNSDITTFLDDYHKRRIDDFFWYVLPVMRSLHSHGVAIPRDDVILELKKHENHFPVSSNTSVSNKPNHTGLASLFLKEIDAQKFGDQVESMVRWILEDHRREDNGTIHWDNSIGVTSYVLIDLAELGRARDTMLAPYISASLAFLKPGSDGSMPTDRFASTYGTAIHEGRMYTTLLACRAFVAVMGNRECPMTIAAGMGVERTVVGGVRTAVARSLYRRRNVLVRLGLVVTILLLAFALILVLGLGGLITNVALIILGIIGGFLMENLIDRLLDHDVKH